MNAPKLSKACAAGRHDNCTRRSCSCECHVVTTPMTETLTKELTELFESTAAEKAFRKAADRTTRVERIVLLAERIADLARELNQ